jgi:hypothetical protein
MNKHKLVQIILRDLEELKILSEEVAENQNNATSIIDLALNKARLLYQEIKLLHEFANVSDTPEEDNLEDPIDEDEDLVSEAAIADPEFEILNFGDPEFPENEETAKEEALDDEAIEDELLDNDLDEEDLADDELGNDDEEGDVIDKKDEVIIEEETEESKQKREFDISEKKEDPLSKSNIGLTDQKNDQQSGIQEIKANDLEDEFEPVQFSPLSDTSARMVMREIPKPENPTPEKSVIGESSPKDRSVNDIISETKSSESKLTSGPITSLRAAIGLNDRFLFIKEIFKNNTEKYNTVIDQLDKLETIQQAVEYLKANLSLEKNNTSLKFVDLLKRRFSK